MWPWWIETSLNQGNFFELHKFLARHNKEVVIHVLKNALGNDQLIDVVSQKYIVSVATT